MISPQNYIFNKYYRYSSLLIRKVCNIKMQVGKSVIQLLHNFYTFLIIWFHKSNNSSRNRNFHLNENYAISIWNYHTNIKDNQNYHPSNINFNSFQRKNSHKRLILRNSSFFCRLQNKRQVVILSYYKKYHKKLQIY